MPKRHPQHSESLTPSRDVFPRSCSAIAPGVYVHDVLGPEMRLEAHEILHCLRGQLKGTHRDQIWGGWYHRSFKMVDLPQLQGEHGLDFFNKTVPIYIMRGDRQEQGPWSGLLSAVLHNYLYRKWFRPYRTDIERSQFIAKIVNCKDQPLSNDDTTAVDVTMAIRSTIQTRLLEPPPKQFYTIPALFKALIIIIPSQSYSICSSIANISAKSVLVLLTGENDGPSSPITFDSIEDHVERELHSVACPESERNLRLRQISSCPWRNARSLLSVRNRILFHQQPGTLAMSMQGLIHTCTSMKNELP